MALLYGIHPVREALRESPESLEQLYFSADLTNPRLQELLQQARQKGLPYRQVPEAALSRMAGSTLHQGVVARWAEFFFREREEILDGLPPPGLLLVLDEIQDPQNLGAILRSADGAGVNGVFLPKHHAVGITPAVVKASAGAALSMKIGRETNLNRFLEEIKEDGYWVVGLDAAGEKLWTAYDFRHPTVLVLGNEGRGIRPLVRRNCDELVRIPMLGRVESLNVSVAAAVILYEAVRQRQSGNTHFGGPVLSQKT